MPWMGLLQQRCLSYHMAKLKPEFTPNSSLHEGLLTYTIAMYVRATRSARGSYRSPP